MSYLRVNNTDFPVVSEVTNELRDSEKKKEVC